MPESSSELLPLSFAQQRLWFLDQLLPKTPLYNVPLAFRIDGALNPGALEMSLRAIIQRHEILRTVYLYTDDGPAQRVLDDFSFALPVRPIRRAELQDRLTEQARHPFDLGGDLMLRAALFRVEEGGHVLFLNIHHIAFDEWSEDVLLRELTAGYQSFCAGCPPSLPELPIQYADFALWQRETAQQRRWAPQLEYWKRELAGQWLRTQLPSVQTRPASPGYEGDRECLMLGPSLTGALRALARAEGVTLHILLLAAFQTLLHRCSGQEEIVLGTPIAGRTRIETEPVIGFFVNTLALRVSFAGSPAFRELLARVRRASVEAFSNQEIPFDQVVEAVRPQRAAHQNPLFDVVFSVQSGSNQEIDCGDLKWTALEVHTHTAKFDLTFVVADRKENLQAILEYNTGVFGAPDARRMLRHFQTLLRGIVAHPSEPVAILPLLGPAEKIQILEEWNRTATEYPRNKTVHSLFEEQAARTPAALAVCYGSESLSYERLNERSNQLAHFLRGAGVGPDVPVGVLMERSIDMIVAWLAILKAGGAYVPLDPEYPAQRLAFMVEDTRMPVILTKACFEESLRGGPARAIRLDSDAKAIAREPVLPPPIQTTSENLAYIIYTSGSTGTPKGVAVPHRAIVRLVCQTNFIEFDGSERMAQLSNSSFDAATFEVWGALLHGGALIGVPKPVLLVPAEFARFIQQERLSAFFLTTALFNQMAAESPGAFRTVKTVLTGGDAVDPKSCQRVLQCGPPARLLNGYGPTESTTFATWFEIKNVSENTASIPIGRPLSNTTCFILDANQQPVPVGVPGELHLGGDGLAQGYFNRPELTAARFVPNPFSIEASQRLYKTGDLARYLPDGNIEFLGRLDHQVKIRGFRVELGEIESVLRQHPGVTDALVLLQNNGPGDKRLLAYVSRDPKRAPLAAELRRFLKSKLPDYMLPAVWVEIDAFPLTPNGKIDRRALPEPGAVTPDAGDLTPPPTHWQSRLRAAWEETLGHKSFGPDDNFFEIGGHSLLAVKLMFQIEKVVGRKLPVQILFQAPTLEKLAELISQQDASAPGACLVEIQPRGVRRPIFWLHTLGGGGGGGLFTYRKLALRLGPDQPSYGFVAPVPPLTTIEAMAARYVEEMRAVQPNGPYQLGGYCFGGVVAFEMVRQLEAQGEEASVLALLDSSPPDAAGRLSQPSLKLARHFLRTAPVWLAGVAKGGLRPLARTLVAAAEGLKRKWRQPKLEEVLDMTHYPADYKNYARVHWDALMRYVPQPIRGRVVLFKTEECHPLRLDGRDEWRKLAPNGMEVRRVPGKHEQILEEPHVQFLAGQLKELMANST